MYSRDDAAAVAGDDGEGDCAALLFLGGGEVVDAEDILGGAVWC